MRLATKAYKYHCVRRLVAQHLRLATQGALREKKLAYLGQQEVWFAAIKDAVAQEAALYKRAGSKQVLLCCCGNACCQACR